MNYIKNVLKRISILLLVASILLTIYLIICPVRTLGEVLEKKEIDIFTDSYERKDYELKNDILGIKEKSPSENNFYFSSPDDKDELCKLLSSLKVRKKLGGYQSHPDEDSYEYWIHFFWNQNLDIMLCQKELCFETSPAIRYGSSKFNAYYIVNCPENEEILKKILELLLNKMKL